MSYSITLDERYGGTHLSSAPGARDAPYSLQTPYILAAGFYNAGYGYLAQNIYLADKDTYSLGLLSPGRYNIFASWETWDYGAATWYSSPVVEVVDAKGNIIANSNFGTVSFNVNSTDTYFVSTIGNT